MDTIKFIIEDYVDEEARFRFPVINIYISGQNLIDRVRQVETRGRAQEQQQDARWYYIGFEVSQFKRFYNEMLGKKLFAKTVLLTCTCTYEGCNCIVADLEFGTDTVTWSNLKSPWMSAKTPNPNLDEETMQELDWHPVDYSGLGPFTFDREKYLAALEAVARAWKINPAWSRWGK